jgi:RNA polymerase sigma factor (sigma-70 family)
MRDDTTDVLMRWNGGDEAALEVLLRDHLPWIRGFVRARLGEHLRARLESGDIVGEAMLDFLKYGPRIKPKDGAQFRRLVGRIVLNTIRDASDALKAYRRAAAKEHPLSTTVIIDLAARGKDAAPPDEHVAKAEEAAQIRLVLELVAKADADLLARRYWKRSTFGEIGAELGISEDAARMRCHTAEGRLAKGLVALRAGDVDALLDMFPEDEAA